jgi:hypothetical protein
MDLKGLPIPKRVLKVVPVSNELPMPPAAEGSDFLHVVARSER